MRQRHSSAVPSSANTHRTQNPIPTKSQPQEKEGPQFDLIASPKIVYALCLAFRMVNAVLVQTYFNPDEHWQALEVAHRITFGFGHLTWEWKKGIRSFLHPLLFALLYKLLTFLGLDTPWFMVKAPRLFQSLFSAFGGLYLYKLSVIFFGDQVAKWALFSQLTNWLVFFCLTRTLSNSLETVLTIVSLYYWPCMRPSFNKLPLESRKWGLIIAALACAIRPTSAIIWLYAGLLELFVTRDTPKFIFHEVAPIGVLVLGITFLIDRLMYGSWILVPLNFLRFNFLSSGGDYYGTHKWHWYFTQGFSVMVFSFLPFSIYGIMQSKQWKLSGLVAWVLGVYSVLGHKEFRFVLPVLPIALIFSGYSLAALQTSVSGNGQRKESSDYHTKCSAKMQLAIFFLLATNIPMAFYMSLVHQVHHFAPLITTKSGKLLFGVWLANSSMFLLSVLYSYNQRGTEDVTYYLSKEVVKGKVRDILFLMPCHATPYYSTVHRNLPMRFLDCSPSEEKGIPDESDQFMMDPVGFASEFAKNWSLPSHIVLFDSEEKLLQEFLFSLKEIKRFFHAHFKVDRDLQASVVVYTSTGS